MSEQNPQLVTFEIDGQEVQGLKGSMLIEVTDQLGIAVPRFCYHKKLTIAANCRMCLVEVERAPKPLPACATPIMEGMKVFTRSPIAKAAQRGTMEFLLINHPLDCPVCDQGGECELQDLSLEYGGDISRYGEGKRVIPDRNIGPLISTEFTRCIHCTRCVRFGEEIAGVRELGATGRGEHMQIGTYIEKAVSSEMSGNVIDLCPVGALTAKPSRFIARAWEMQQYETIAPHDCVGSNLYVHTRWGEMIRAVPRENEAINEVWISDRDRFGYEGLKSKDRLTKPMLKKDGQWRDVSWEVALEAAANLLKAVPANKLGVLASANSTLEELWLTRKIAEGLGTPHLDHRLRQMDQSDAHFIPQLGSSIAELETLDAALLVGSYLRKDQPILAHRLRKAAMKGAKISFINPIRFEFHFPVAQQIFVKPSALVDELAAVAKALVNSISLEVPTKLASFLEHAKVRAEHQAIADSLRQEKTAVVLGNIAASSEDLSVLYALGHWIARWTESSFSFLAEGANAVGACVASVLPSAGGQSARQMLESGMDAFLLLNVEPELEAADTGMALRAVQHAQQVVVLTPFVTDTIKAYADLLLPIATFGETAGTFVNIEGKRQSFNGSFLPPGEARPGWKVLRVLGNHLDLAGFDYEDSTDVLAKVPDRSPAGADLESLDLALAEVEAGLTRVGTVPIYAGDNLVRRAAALQRTEDAKVRKIVVNGKLAERLALTPGQEVLAKQGQGEVRLPLEISDWVPDDVVWLASGIAETVALGSAYGGIELSKA